MLLKLFPLLICENYKKEMFKLFKNPFFLSFVENYCSYVTKNLRCYSHLWMMSLNHLESDQMCSPHHIAIKVKDISYLSI